MIYSYRDHIPTDEGYQHGYIYLVAHPTNRIVCYNPSYEWIKPTYPTYNKGYKRTLLRLWDEPPSIMYIFNRVELASIVFVCLSV